MLHSMVSNLELKLIRQPGSGGFDLKSKTMLY